MNTPSGLRKPIIPLVRATISARDRHAVIAAVRTGRAFDDELVDEFENQVARKFGAAGAVAVSSGTAALHLALKALGAGPGAEVILPTFSCVALLHAVNASGAAPVLIDNESHISSYRLTPTKAHVRKAMTRNTKAAILIQPFGALSDTVAECEGMLPLIEDFTLSLGARQGQRFAGTFSGIGIASLHDSKMLSTGQGGIVLARDRSLLDKVRALSRYDDLAAIVRCAPPATVQGTYAPSFNYRMSPLQAALGISQLEQLDQFIRKRIGMAREYSAFFRTHGFECPTVTEDGSNVYYRYLMPVSKSVPAALKRLRSAGVEMGRGIYPAIHSLLGLAPTLFPGASVCTRVMLSVPLYPSLSRSDREYCLDSVVREFAVRR